VIKKKGGGGDEGGSWMDTYGDLVTLLLTFFVLLYSMSSVDSQKWDIFVRSIYPDGVTPSERLKAKDAEEEPIVLNGEIETDVSETDADNGLGDASVEQNTIDSDSNQLYLQIASALKKAGLSQDAEVTGGEDYTFVVFKDKAFFGGDSSVLTEEGKKTLDVFSDTIQGTNDLISQVNVMGHTAQADPGQSNNLRSDRMLSSMRAAEVTVYLQEKSIIDPDKFVSIGYGQYKPLESNDTPEGRAANRRVEILLIDKDAKDKSLDDYYKEIQENINGDTSMVLMEDGSNPAAESREAEPGS
jgi:chemotaxis protein MotB